RRHALRPDARLAPSRLRDDPLLLRDGVLLELHVPTLELVQGRLERLAARRPRGAADLPQPARLGLLGAADYRGGGGSRDRQDFSCGTLVWICFAYAVIGPLFLTNILWFTAIDRVGPSRASLFANMQPFFSVIFALLLLHEHLNRWEVAGGFAIAAAIAVER